MIRSPAFTGTVTFAGCAIVFSIPIPKRPPTPCPVAYTSVSVPCVRNTLWYALMATRSIVVRVLRKCSALSGCARPWTFPMPRL
uniref:Putative secreted protein n=1 Tax=Anopheles darlingi TaxID=43151 RepID=A0A2M4DIX8_ANODA